MEAETLKKDWMANSKQCVESEHTESGMLPRSRSVRLLVQQMTLTHGMDSHKTKEELKKEPAGAVNHVSFNLHPAAYKLTGHNYSSPKSDGKPFWVKLFLALGVGLMVFEL